MNENVAMSYLPHFKLWETSKYVNHEGINKKEASPTKHFNFSVVKFFQKDSLKNGLFLMFHPSLNSLFTQ